MYRFDACPFFDGRVYFNGLVSKTFHSKHWWETSNLLQQEISQRSTNRRNRSRDQTGHSIWVLTQKGDIEERELVGGIAERASKHWTDDGAEWPTERVKWQRDGLVRGIGELSKDAVNDSDVS